MSDRIPCHRAKRAHEVHVVVVENCPRCARHIVLVGRVDQYSAHDDREDAIAAAEKLREEITGRPDPAPILVTGSPPEPPRTAVDVFGHPADG